MQIFRERNGCLYFCWTYFVHFSWFLIYWVITCNFTWAKLSRLYSMNTPRSLTLKKISFYIKRWTRRWKWQTTSAPMAWLFLPENELPQWQQKIAQCAKNAIRPQMVSLSGLALFSARSAIFCRYWTCTFSGRWHGYWCLCRCHFHLFVSMSFVISLLFAIRLKSTPQR